MTTFSTTLKELRLARSYSQRDLAQLLGCDHTYISKLENGTADYPPSERVLRAIASLFDVEPDWLIFQAGKIPSAYHDLLSELAKKHGQKLPEIFKNLLESDRDVH